jgi:isoleucyl-tRNA synthetase
MPQRRGQHWQQRSQNDFYVEAVPKLSDYKSTVNLPQTDFAMKADLARREPDTQKWWEANDVYGQLRKLAKGRPRFALHDGPPYANGAIHIGHAANKILKDFIIKSRSLDGYDSPYIPGWDCHGLPIELQVEKKHGRVGQKLDARAFRAACRAYATEQVELQRKDFKRLGVLGDWDRPYITMDKKYEAQQIRSLGKVIKNGHLYKGAKPVYWCLDCRSALAEAEVEYEDKTSQAIDVAFPVVDVADLCKRIKFAEAAPSSIGVVIWTTTPWTLPANEAVAVRGEFDYQLLEVLVAGRTQLLILAEGLRDACLGRYGADGAQSKVLAKFSGSALEGLQLRHPFQDRNVPIILGDHVTLEAGTGAVHTAPAHGQDDYIVGRRYNLPVVNPVLGDGRFQADVPLVGGMKLDEAGKLIIDTLEQRGHLLKHESLRHSYPHCWRHKSPVIFRATPQWFISMDNKGLRKNALRDIPKVQWIPAWGQQRIAGMIETRPDWCISRQRTWGVPITLFLHHETEALHPRTVELIEAVAQRVEAAGIEAWFDLDPRELLGEEAESYRKVTDVMDVWADSGVSFECVGSERPELAAPVEMYLEGSDQHRGWFHSSLLMSEAMYERAPYKSVLTYGFTVDDKGRKMSKSLGNVVAPDKVMNSLGADVLRLWVAATDYTSEMSCSDEILKRTSDSYRRIRNTVRFLLGNLHGFDPEVHSVPAAQMIALDAWALARTAALQAEIVAAYREYQFHVVYQRIHNFCVNDLGGLYLDILKDRMYTTPVEAHTRRSAQTVMFHIVQAMARWLAPILSFTAEEIWQAMPGRKDAAASVFLARWHELPVVAESTVDWPALIALRQAVQRQLEVMREAGTIGAPLDAEVEVFCEAAAFDRYNSLGAELKFFFITSAAKVTRVALAPADAVPALAGNEVLPGVSIKAQKSQYLKCVRCWHHVDDVGAEKEHPELCQRCARNVMGQAEVRRYV